jgi:hypothetical protein
MQSKVPIPTDNIFKFYALFGLVIFIFGFYFIFHLNSTTNDLLFDTILEIEILQSNSEITKVQQTELDILERKQEIAIKDKKGFVIICGIISGFGACLMFYGFYYWHTKIQPLQDQILELTVKKLEQELSITNRPFKRVTKKESSR